MGSRAITSRTALLPACAAAVLLSACGNDHRKPPVDAAPRVVPPPVVQQAGTAAAPAAPRQPRTFDYWEFVAPLVAGTYSGTCRIVPGYARIKGKVTVGADGKASARQLDADFRDAKSIIVGRSRHPNGAYTALALLSSAAGDAELVVQAELAESDNGATLGNGREGLICHHTGPMAQLNARPLYLSLADLLDGPRQTVSCAAGSQAAARREVDLWVADGVVTVGTETFDIKQATYEGFIVRDGGKTLTLKLALPDERELAVTYDRAGRIAAVQGLAGERDTHACQAL